MSYERVYDKKFGNFYDGLKTKTRMAMNYNYIFLVRRFIFVFSAFYWYGQVAIQIGIFVLTTEFYCMYLYHAKPFVDSSINKQEIFNELTIILVSYHLICFTDFVRNA
jgi:hypothetical protein